MNARGGLKAPVARSPVGRCSYRADCVNKTLGNDRLEQKRSKDSSQETAAITDAPKANSAAAQVGGGNYVMEETDQTQ